MKKFKITPEFFAGKTYPLLMSILILIGYFFKIEAYTATLNMIIVGVAFLTSPSIKPLMFFALTFFYQMTVTNSPMNPTKSDHYFTGIRPYLLIGGALVFFVCGFIYVLRNKFFTKINFFKIPLFVPMLVLSFGFAANGLFTKDYTIGNLLWALALLVVYVLFFLMLYLGLMDEDPHEIAEYFTYISLLISWILLLQVAQIYLEGNLFAGGGVNRGAFTLGFGKTNAVGFVLAMLIPINFYGFMRNKYKYIPYIHLFTAIALMGATLTSTSRNAVLVGGIYFAFCFIFIMFAGERKKIARIFVPASIVAVALVVLLFFKDEFVSLIMHYVNRSKIDGFTQNDLNSSSAGRINIWIRCFEIFKENPIFGAGFYGEPMKFATPMAEIIPHFAHNTLFQLLSGLGIVGTLCYGYYRICTLKYLFRKPSLDRFMMMVSASMLLAGSLLDNHLFNIYPGLSYTIALVIAVLLYEKQYAPKKADTVDELECDENENEEIESDSQQRSEFIENIAEMLEESKEIMNS